MSARGRLGPATGRLTAQAWFLAVLALLVVLVIAGAAVGGVMMTRTDDASDRVLDRLQPAAALTYRMQAALVNQETGIRGYAISADPQFLAPYLDGIQAENEAANRIRQLLADRPALLADLDRLREAASDWRVGYARPLADQVTPGTPRALDRSAAMRGKLIFDGVRRRFTAQNDDLAAAIAAARADVKHVRAERNTVLVGMVAAFLAAGIALTALVRRLVTRPLAQLEDATKRVAAGDFTHHIPARGPADLVTVAVAVESMRERIVSELDSSRAQEAVLQQQAADLDAQAVELRRSNTELEQFAYVASHDLQEPLRKVASFCQLIEKRYGDQLDDRGKQYIEFAVDGAKRMQVLINDLLAFSRVGRFNERNVAVRLDATLDKALASIDAAVAESDARIERPAELPEITGDPTLLAMLWQNLLANSIKFRRPDRSPVVTIGCAPERDPDTETDLWRITVTDNGIGVQPEFAEKVFVIFQRLHSREEYGGTGIGLAICRKIVEYHGGRIWIDPAYSDGARFHLTLPVAAEPAATEHDRPSMTKETP